MSAHSQWQIKTTSADYFLGPRERRTGANARGRTSALLPDALAHSPQIEHSGTAEKSGK
jgi:hypothetical protein